MCYFLLSQILSYVFFILFWRLYLVVTLPFIILEHVPNIWSVLIDYKCAERSPSNILSPHFISTRIDQY